MQNCFLGVDNGGTMTKAAVFDENGRQLSVCEEETPLILPEENFCERDMQALWEATARVIRQAVHSAGADADEIASVGCTGHGKGLYLWGKNDRPCCRAIASTDRRAEEYLTGWEQDGTLQQAREKILQDVIACQPVALLRWMKDHRPENYAGIRWVFEAKDYIRFRLTGEAFAEETDTSGTGLMNLLRREYDPALLALFGIPEIQDALPPIRRSADLCGRITPQAAALTGLKPGTPVSGGMFDIDACALAMNVSREEQLCVITGTWSINEYLSQTPVTSPGTTRNSLFCIPGYYLIEESSPTSAGNLNWMAAQFFDGERRQAEKEGISVFRKLDQMAAAAPPDPQLLFYPFLYGTNASLQKSALLGMTVNTTKAALARAILEGVVFSHYSHIERLLQHRTMPKAIRIAGGAVHSSVWLSLFADTFGIPLEVVGVKELGALGAAMSAAVCAGKYSDCRTAADNMTRVKQTILPHPENTEMLRKKYQNYCHTLFQLEK